MFCGIYFIFITWIFPVRNASFAYVTAWFFSRKLTFMRPLRASKLPIMKCVISMGAQNAVIIPQTRKDT